MPKLCRRIALAAARPWRRALPALLLALAAAQSAGGVEAASRTETSLSMNGKRLAITLADVRAMREALETYLADHPPETRLTLPPNWRDRVPAPVGEAFIDADGVARLPPWLLEVSPSLGAPVLTTRWMGETGGGILLLATVRRHGAGWIVDGLSWATLRPRR